MSGNVPFGLEMGEPEDVGADGRVPVLRPRPRHHRPDLHGERRPRRGVEPAGRGTRDAQGRPVDASTSSRPGSARSARSRCRSSPRWRNAKRRGEARRQAEPVTHARATPPCGSACGRASPRSRSSPATTTQRSFPAAGWCARRCGTAATSTSRGRARSRSSRGQHDRGAARPSLGEPARTTGLPRRPARVDLTGDRPADRSERSPDSRQPPRRAVRGRARAHEPARRAAASPGSTTDRGPTSSRAFPFPHVSPSTPGSTSASSGSRPRSSRPVAPRCRSRSAGTPYLRLPDAPRREWELRWPACDRVPVDERVLPTGELVGQPAERAALGSRTFDDHYALGTDRRFSLSRRTAQGRAAVRPDLPVRAALRARRAATSPRSNR